MSSSKERRRLMLTENVAQEKGETLCAVCVDMGTTNTRVWLTHGDRVLARANAAVGVRDTARDGSHERVRQALHDLIGKVRADGRGVGSPTPKCVIAAGMITSPLGLVEVPHVAAPAGLTELAARIERRSFPEITDLPVLLVPGVRSGLAQCRVETIGEGDVMRGEETLCVGLVALGLLKPGGTLLNLGSHWKAIRLDGDNRVASSVTSMGGELIHVAQTQTILASAVPSERPSVLDEKSVEAGMSEQRQSGLARALFCVRLLEQTCDNSTPTDRLSFLVGAFIAADLDALLTRRMFSAECQVVITGGGAVSAAWTRALLKASVPAIALTADQIERAQLTGLRHVAAASTALQQL